MTNHCVCFSYIFSEDYKLDLNFYGTSEDNKSYVFPTKHDTNVWQIVLVIAEEWLSEINSTDIVNFTKALIQHIRIRISKIK